MLLFFKGVGKLKYNINKLINKKIIKADMTLVYITCKNKKEAERISLHLLKKRIIACANLFPIKSMYWWEGKIAKDNETVIIAKTNNKNFKKLESEVKRIHSYGIPCILRISAAANKEYQAWLKKEIK